MLCLYQGRSVYVKTKIKIKTTGRKCFEIPDKILKNIQNKTNFEYTSISGDSMQMRIEIQKIPWQDGHNCLHLQENASKYSCRILRNGPWQIPYEDHRNPDTYRLQSLHMSARIHTGMRTCHPRPVPDL